MTLHWAVGLLVAFFICTVILGFGQFWVLVEMTEKVNHRKGSGDEIDPFVLSLRRASWLHVLREYRRTYPGGKLASLMFVSGGAFIVCVIAIFSLLFGVLPHWAIPSR